MSDGDGAKRVIQKVPAKTATGKRGCCEHGRKKSRCRECGGGSFCEHNVQRYNCHKCIQARCISSLVDSLRITAASNIGGCSDQAKIMLLELQVKALTEQRDNLLRILEQNQVFATSQIVCQCLGCMQGLPTHGMQTHGMQTQGIQTHGMQTLGMQSLGMQPLGMQSLGMQPLGMQTHGMQPHGMQPLGMQPHGMQSLGMQPLGMQTHGMQTHGASL
jgi:hypothetical protein